MIKYFGHQTNLSKLEVWSLPPDISSAPQFRTAVNVRRMKSVLLQTPLLEG